MSDNLSARFIFPQTKGFALWYWIGLYQTVMSCHLILHD